MNLWQRARRSSRGDILETGPSIYEQLFMLTGRAGATQGLEVSVNNLDLTTEFVFKQSGPIFALVNLRAQLISEARFAFQRIRAGRPGDLFTNADLALLEHPFGPASTTGDLLTRIVLDIDLAGNCFLTNRIPGQLRRLRPDWVTIVHASREWPDLSVDALDAELVGYIYTPRLPGGGWATEENGAVMLAPEEVAHIAPTPDPQASHRGMSWLSPVIREVEADNAALRHKGDFFKNGAVPRLAMKIDPGIDESDFKRLAAIVESHHTGPGNAWKTLYLGGGADPLPLTFNLKDLDYKAVTALGETRLAAAAGVPPTVVGFSEGLAGSSLNAGNYGQAKRRLGDGTLRPLWRNICGSLEAVVPTPSDARLWFDDRDIAFLRDDEKDASEIVETRATTISILVSAGYTPDSAAQAAVSGDFSVLQHTGLFSVQLQPPGDGEMQSDGTAGPAPADAPTEPDDDDPQSTSTTKPAAPGKASKA